MVSHYNQLTYENMRPIRIILYRAAEMWHFLSLIEITQKSHSTCICPYVPSMQNYHSEQDMPAVSLTHVDIPMFENILHPKFPLQRFFSVENFCRSGQNVRTQKYSACLLFIILTQTKIFLCQKFLLLQKYISSWEIVHVHTQTHTRTHTHTNEHSYKHTHI